MSVRSQGPDESYSFCDDILSLINVRLISEEISECSV